MDLECEGDNEDELVVKFSNMPLASVVRTVEREYICSVLNKSGGNKAEAARMAGLTYQTFTRKLAALNLKVTYHAS